MNELTKHYNCYGVLIPEGVTEFFDISEADSCYLCSDCETGLSPDENTRPCWNCNYDESDRYFYFTDETGEIHYADE